MKALKSALAKSVLADPKAKVQLRTYLANKNSRPSLSSVAMSGAVINLDSAQEGSVLYQLKVVPKAA